MFEVVLNFEKLILKKVLKLNKQKNPKHYNFPGCIKPIAP